MTRAKNIAALLSQAASEASIVNDAFGEVIQLLRLAASGQDISQRADAILKEFDRRTLISTEAYTVADRLHAVLNSTTPPVGLTPVHWENLLPVRKAFKKIIDNNLDKCETAMKSEMHRNWFVGQLVKAFGNSFGVPALSSLVFKSFMGAAR